MSAKIIDGNLVSAAIRNEIRQRVAHVTKALSMPPGLTVIIVGDNPASAAYVRNKVRACHEVGIRSEVIQLPSTVSEVELLRRIEQLNTTHTVHGILVQLPLPQPISVRRVLEGISVDKDVDGFHLYNVGGLVIGETVFPPCTPNGVQKLLDHEEIAVEGKNVTVAGASNIVRGFK